MPRPREPLPPSCGATGRTSTPTRDYPLLVVDEPVAALQRLAAWWRAQLDDLLVVGITGSVGKTSTKETIASVLERSMPTYRSAGNLNSRSGCRCPCSR